MNDEPNLDLSLSSFQNPNPQAFDSFDMSVEYNDKRPSFNPFNEQPKIPFPQLESPVNHRNIPPVEASSLANAAPPTQGEIKSGTEIGNHPTTFGGIPPDQHPNQSQSQEQRENRSYDNQIFSFRRDHNPAPAPQEREQENVVNIGGQENASGSPRNEVDSYERTKTLFVKIKKYYIYYFLNVLLFGLTVFNLIVAYKSEVITFPRLEGIESQFKQKIVMDINVVPKTEGCRDNYSAPQLGTWPGLKQICKCSDGTYYRECQASEIQAGCQNIGSFDPVSGENWDGKKICLKKSDKSFYDYYETSGFMESYSGNLLCPNSQKKCMVSTSKNFICVGRLEACPVSQFEIVGTPSNSRLRAQIQLGSKILTFDTQGSNATTYMDVIIEPPRCSQDPQGKYCSNITRKELLDSEKEYTFIKDNAVGWQSQDIENFRTSDNEMQIYAAHMNYVDMCIFNSTFNPVILSSQLSNWKAVKYLLFINPFFLTTLLVLNIIRALTIKLINAPTSDRVIQRRKKEIYVMFGNSFGSASLVSTAEILTMLYYIFWGYLLLNPDRLLAEKWLAMGCVDSDVKAELQYMVSQFIKIESFNMVIIGPMIFGVVMEAIFSQFRLLIRPYSRISRDDQSMRE